MSLLEDLFVAYYDARTHKRNTINQLHFEMELEENLVGLYREIDERRYRVGRSVCFMITNPVKREVFAADFRDRVVHHLLFNYINPIFEPTFIADCYACRKGKGTLYGIQRLDKHIRSCSDNYRKPCYILKLDLRGYFMNINRQILFDIINRRMRLFGRKRNQAGVLHKETPEYEVAMYLIPLIVFNDPVDSCLRKGAKEEWEGLPASKSLFFSPEGCGLPIGNLTSQLFSNIYLNEFDNHVKRVLGIRHYGRYVDDFYLVHNDRQYLLSLIPVIRDYLMDSRGAVLHPDKIRLVDHRQGITFLGSVVKPYRIGLSGRIFRQFDQCLEHWSRKLSRDDEWDLATRMELRASVNSYLGIMVHFNTMRRKKEVVERHPYLYRLGYFSNHMDKFILKKQEKEKEEERLMSGVADATASVKCDV